MTRESFAVQELEQLLRRAEERDVPPGLCLQIMNQIDTAPPVSPVKARAWWNGICTVRFQPFKFATAMVAASVIFWLGTITGPMLSRPVASITAPAGIEPIGSNARANYFIGRGLLTAGEKDQAMKFLQAAAIQDTGSAEFEYWQGVAYSSLGNRDKERQSYQHLLQKQPDYLPALLNLGHNFLESGSSPEALQQYEQVLQLNPAEQTALYNRGLAYLQQREPEKARWAFEQYLVQYRTEKWAYRTVDHLQELGNFDYRVYEVGNNKIIGNQRLLLGPELPARQLELELLAGWIKKAPASELHLVVYYQGDKEKGRQIAIDLRKQLVAVMGESLTIPIRISWFDEPEQTGSAGGRTAQLPQGLLIFTQPSTIQKGNTI